MKRWRTPVVLSQLGAETPKDSAAVLRYAGLFRELLGEGSQG